MKHKPKDNSVRERIELRWLIMETDTFTKSADQTIKALEEAVKNLNKYIEYKEEYRLDKMGLDESLDNTEKQFKLKCKKRTKKHPGGLLDV